MARVVVATDLAPQALGTYAQAVCCQDTVYCSGQLGIDPQTGMLQDGIEAQIKQVFSNLQAVLQAADSQLEQVCRMTVYLADLKDFEVLNAVSGLYFQPPYPARAVVEAARLPKDALIEIEAIASRSIRV